MMRASTKYIFLAAMPLMAACGETLIPQIDDADNKYISISVGFDTRTLIHPNDLTAEGTELKLYGFASKDNSNTPIFNGYTATPPVTTTSNGSTGQVSKISVVSWDVKDNNGATVSAQEWDDAADYTFYSWIQKDKNNNTAAAFFNDGSFSYSGASGSTPAKLSIAKKMPIDGTGFDFCYSDVVTRDNEDKDQSSVVLKLNHLFASFTLSASNAMDEQVTITSVKLFGLKDKKSATIEFGADEVTTDGTSKVTKVTLAYAESTMESGTTKLNSSNVVLAAGTTKENIVGTASDVAMPILMWPQTVSELGTTGYTNSKTQPTGGAFMEVKYKIGSAGEQTRYLKMQKEATDSWEAGVCQNIVLSFSDNDPLLIVKPMPWVYAEPTLDYDRGIAVEKMLTVDELTCTKDGNKIYFKDGLPIKIKFCFTQPENGTWLISRDGDFGFFEIDNATLVDGIPVSQYGDGEDYNHGTIDGEESTVTIYPKVIDPERDYKITLSFSVRSINGTVDSADELVQGTDPSQYYTFILQAS